MHTRQIFFNPTECNTIKEPRALNKPMSKLASQFWNKRKCVNFSIFDNFQRLASIEHN